ncbi:acyl-ACP--UDP-N-acetylglucosamine O-acyltransferase [Aeoliella mucimassa]|uniref:acyl-ACP--UDP-N-acetylglucosamine O-acyltransferase n=1 Tax=Aeoliella mucimassa TaxID=2527972 RepID=UPI0018D2B9C1|nr:acyl-ACP--UDP-N-acetylglucosamine O-acyltransferase [Aeoliella mucimassa]
MIIHPLAEVSPRAKLGVDVEIGPFAVVEDDVEIGDRCQIAARASVKSGTTMGCENLIGEGAIVGGLPQHLHQPENPGRLMIGDRNMIRENVTLHRAFIPDQATIIGNDCLLMVGSHIAHDCIIGNNVVLTNNALLGGHVTVGDRAYLGGGAAVHQFCHIGRVAMIGGLARLDQDVLPYMMVDGESNRVVGLNRVGLRRAGATPHERTQIKEAYNLIYRSGFHFEQLIEALEEQYDAGPAAEFAPFLRTGTRGYIRERRDPPKSFRLVREDPAADSKLIVEPVKQAG